MNILIFGACSKTGKKLVARGLRRGHFVTAVVENPEKLQLFDDNLKVIGKDTLNNDFSGVLSGQNVVINVICREKMRILSRLKKKSPLVINDILPAMSNQSQVRRLLVVNARSFVSKKLLQNHSDLVKNSGLDWTIVNPARLVDKPKTGRYKLSLNFPKNPLAKVSHADVADFVIDNIENRNLVGKSISIRY
jgi:putative NADH-flavin reductase